MTKITNLPPAGPIAGNEPVPIVQDGETRRTTMDALAAPMIEAMRETALAGDVFPTLAAGEAATATGGYFRYFDATGKVCAARRTAGGSDPVTHVLSVGSVAGAVAQGPSIAAIVPSAADAPAVLLTGAAGGALVFETARAPYTVDNHFVFAAPGVDPTVGAYVRMPVAPIDSPNPTACFVRQVHGIYRKTADLGAHILANSEHIPDGFSGAYIRGPAEANPGTVDLILTRPGTANGGWQVTPDEVYGGNGAFVGVKGFATGPRLFIYRALEFSVNLSTLSVTPHPWFDTSAFTVTSDVSGKITIQHPSVGNASTPVLMDVLDAQYDVRRVKGVTAASGLTGSAATSGVASTFFSIQVFTPLAGRIRRLSAGTLTCDSALSTAPTATLGAGGLLTVQLNQGDYAIANGHQFDFQIWSYLDGVKVTQFALGADRNSFTAVLLTDAGDPVTDLTQVGIGFRSSWNVPAKTRPSKTVQFRRGVAQANAANITNETSNLWIHGSPVNAVRA